MTTHPDEKETSHFRTVKPGSYDTILVKIPGLFRKLLKA
jgi:hypothetical protein